jgi:hypothetical protein
MGPGTKPLSLLAKHRRKLIPLAAAALSLAVAVVVFGLPVDVIVAIAVLWLLGYLTLGWQIPPKTHWPRGKN